MKKPLFLIIILTLFVTAVAAQSGRRVKPTPTPVATATNSGGGEDADYSESKPTNGPTYSHRRGSAKNNEPKEIQPKADATVTDASGDDVIKVETSLVTIPVSVYERSGVYVSGLRRNDFKVFEDGKEQEIAYFGTVEQPFSAIMLIDVSGSTDTKIKSIQAAAMSFVDNLRPGDKVMVMEFDESTRTLCDFTSDKAVLAKAIHKVGSGGGTALYSAVETVLKKKLDHVVGRKAVILFTDGVDTSNMLIGGGESGYEKTLAMAEESDAVIYPIYYNTYLEMSGITSGSGPMSGVPIINTGPKQKGERPEDYAHGRTYLSELARLTGGKVYQSDATDGGMSAAFEGIAEELGNQYTIGYYSSEGGKTGERKQVRVRVNRPNCAVRARDNYIVGETPQKPPAPAK
ncbi:MAG: VWA domain-containing protein [Acidobacteria bacterium]|nr:VWA domain-containing protein [Acidobacteriota bacterium]